MAKAWLKGKIQAFSDQESQSDPKATLNSALATKIQRDREVEHGSQLLKSEWPLLWADVDRLIETTSDKQEQRLIRQSGALADAWARFQQKLPRAEQENMRNTPPSLFVLCNAVHAAESRWQSKRDESRWEAVKKTFVKLSRSTEDYSQLLAVVPANDKYISLLTGSLSAVVKASIQHEDIAFAIAEILEQLCKDMKYWKKQIMAHPDVQSMQDDVRELYIVIFELLTEIFTEWSSSSVKRFWKSFDKNVANKLFGSRKVAIERLTLELDRAADLDSQEKNGRMQQYILNLPTKQDLEGVRLQLGEDIVKLFVAVDASDRFASTASLPESASLALHKSHEDQQTSSGKDTALSMQRFKRHDVLRSIPPAERLLQHPLKEVERLRDRASHLEIDRRIVSRLHEWASNKSKSKLWIQGEAHVSTPSQNSLTAIALMVASVRSKSATISVFCNSLQLGQAPEMLRSAIDILIAQAAALLPDEGFTDLDLSPTRIASVRKGEAPISHRIAVLADILSCVSQSVVCIVDGIRRLEDCSDLEHSQQLRNLIQLLCDRQGGTARAELQDKVCFTTDGHVQVLAEMVHLGCLELARCEAEADDRFAEDTAQLGDPYS